MTRTFLAATLTLLALLQTAEAFRASVRASCNLPAKVELAYMEWGDIV